MPRRVLTLPLKPGGDCAYLELTYPLTEEDWQHMLRVLDVMKPGLIGDARPSSGAPVPPTDAP